MSEGEATFVVSLRNVGPLKTYLLIQAPARRLF
jgi:hypothetical protein